RVPLAVPLERRRVVEREPRSRKSLADLGAELLCRLSLSGRELTPQKVRHAAVEVAQPAVDGELDPALALGRLGGGHAVGARDDYEVLVAEVVGRAAHHLELADELIG